MSREQWRPVWSAYLGLVTMVDDCVGIVIDALKDRGLWDDALVIFMQDHGENLGCHSLFQKHCAYEESCRIPMLMKPPRGGFISIGRRHELVGHVDYADTICDYGDLDRLPGSQGRSMRPLIEGATIDWRDTTFIEYNGDHGRNTPIRAVVADVDGATFKYIYNHGDKDELYHLEADPMETTSLTGSEDHSAIKAKLRERLGAWMRETGDFVEMAHTF